MITFKKISIDHRPYYFFSDMIIAKNFNPNLLSIDKISFKSIDAVKCCYYIKYITMKSLDHVNIDCKNSHYLVFNNVDGYIEKNNGDKYLIFASTGKNKKVLKNYIKLWDEIKNKIEKINGGECNSTEPIECKKGFMIITFESDDDLPLGKILSILIMVVTGSVFQEGKKYYPQVLLNE